MRILNRLGFRFGVALSVFAIVSLFAKDTHKVSEVLLFGSLAAAAWLIYFMTRNR